MTCSCWDDWTPTADNINRLPDPLRRYVHDLITRCDPAGDVQRIAVLEDQNRALRTLLRQAHSRPVEDRRQTTFSPLEALGFPCPTCGAEPGDSCVDHDLHGERVRRAQDAFVEWKRGGRPPGLPPSVPA